MKKIIFIIGVCLIIGCKEKLDLKPNTNIILPKTAQDLEAILELDEFVNRTPALGQISSDEYFIPNASAWAATSMVARNASVWNSDVYNGIGRIEDWRIPYGSILIANSVLDVIKTGDVPLDAEVKRIKGRALFIRAYSFYSLVSIFSKAYNASSAMSDLGIPLKLTGGIEDIQPRSTVQETYDQIIKDALEAENLLNNNIIPDKRNQPSKVAVYAFLARVFLSMRVYDKSEQYAEKCLSLYSNLTNFSTLNPLASSAFTFNSVETIYHTNTDVAYSDLYNVNSSYFGVSPELLDLYDKNDMRLVIYFKKNSLDNFVVKPINDDASIPFSGLATDEVYLIKAECLARRNQNVEALDYLNKLAVTRWNPNLTNPAKPYVNVTANNSEEALEKILKERRKSLVWRGLRWTDLKRLNLEGRNMVLTRKIDDKVYTLQPNSPRYVLPIPEDEIALSGIVQNIR